MNKVYSNFAQAKQKIQVIEAIDYFFANEMVQALSHQQTTKNSGEYSSEHNSLLTHILLALSESLRAGHTCLPLHELANKQWGYGSDHYGDVSHPGIIFPDLAALTSAITVLNIAPEYQQPIVYHAGNLYLRRYFQFETELSQDISMRLANRSTFSNDDITACIQCLFPEVVPEEITTVSDIDWQQVAVANAINKGFSVIAGGPGTGKTYTVTKLLAALVMLHQTNNNTAQLQSAQQALNIALVAPTGKAAQRLSESIINAVAGFKDTIDSDVLAKIPTSAQTIHRLLGVIPNSPNFRHNDHNKLPYDVLLIDEVSMVDLPLMTRVFRALKPHTKVILLGDADQLPSVAAGSVLADIAPRPHGGFSQVNYDYLAQVCQLTNRLLPQAFVGAVKPNDYLTYLLKSRRFDGEGGIGLLARAVIEGDSDTSWQFLNKAKENNSEQLTLATTELSAWLSPLIKQYFQPIEYCSTVSEAFNLLAQFRVLCATRKGNYGVEAINDFIKRYLGKGFISQHSEQQGLYHGQPIMISENNYRLGLYNGDIGIIWRVTDSNNNTHLMACFESSDETQPVRHILPSRLPKYETVYAMTIHKTQGSEFTHVAMLLSETGSIQNNKTAESKLLSRELLYTAITRAKKQLTVASNQGTWQQGVIAQVKRHSGFSLNVQ